MLPDFEPRAKIAGNKIIHYTQFHGSRRHTVLSAMPSADRPYSLFADGSQKRLKESLSRWTQTIRFAAQLTRLPVKPLTKHTFITLTLSSSQRHCDKVIKRDCLNLFLITLKNKYNLKNYIWKAEVQRNGNIHYHILQETFLPHTELRTIWNRCQNKLGYVDEFAKRFNQANPNSTDIHALRNVRNVEAYVLKYMVKDSAVRPICGHTWGRSDTFTNLQPFALHNDLELYEWFDMMSSSIEHRTFSGDMFSVTNFKTAPNWRTLPEHHKKTIKEITRHNLSELRLI